VRLLNTLYICIERYLKILRYNKNMKIISLNTWGGRVPQINDFILRHSADTDIFCFQEVHANKSKEADSDAGERPEFFEEVQELLPDFTGIFAEQVIGTGSAMFVRNNLQIENTDSNIILSAEDLSHLGTTGFVYYPRIVQSVILKDPKVTIFNFHGVPGNEKKDSPEREKQMSRLHEILDSHDGEKILVGDFNLRPDTNAIRGLEKKMKNLVIEQGLQTTRTSLYEQKASMPFADYTFVTPGIIIKKFEILTDKVSDHSPMYLDFE
jgi:endonuclease/exonuclease/phosphatase family metal-dependent hydrolase